MDVNKKWADGPADARAVSFRGSWQEYLPIAVTNFLLTIVTLGIFRFWAKARERRYLWSRTQLLGSELEWTGTGGEMFLGFLMAMGVLIGCAVLVLGGGALIGAWFAIVGAIAFYLFAFWAIGFAQFRALRYRLSRTYWRGIRGGSDSDGVGYGWTALGNNLLAGITLGILMPRALTHNWNDRMREMSFGPHMLESDVDTAGLQSRWMMVYAVYFGFGLLMFGTRNAATGAAGAALSVVPLIALFAGLLVVMTSFWALFFRKAAGTFRMGEMTARFDVSTAEWLTFYAKLIGLTVITLGFGALMWGYLRWKFVIDRLELYGEVDVDRLSQSRTVAPRDAEGFAEAFDIGAF